MPSRAELERARELILRHGWNATAYQILNPGIGLWFAKSAEGVIGFVPCYRVRVVAGAPVCAEESLSAVIAEFEGEAAAAGERVCYFAAESRLASHLAGSPNYARLLLGAQPVWLPARWPAILAARASLRAQLNRARNKAVTVRELDTGQAAVVPVLNRLLGEWVATRGLPPLHFLVETQTLERLFDRRVWLAEQRGIIVGYLIATPIPLRNGWLIEQIIRGREAPNGTAELLIDSLMRAAAAEGYDLVTLGLAPLSRRARLPAERTRLWLHLLLIWMRAHGRRFYNFDGLDAFKAKLQPDAWEPIYALANSRNFSPWTLYAAAAAFTHGSPLITIGRGLLRAVRTELRRMAPRG